MEVGQDQWVIYNTKDLVTFKVKMGRVKEQGLIQDFCLEVYLAIVNLCKRENTISLLP